MIEQKRVQFFFVLFIWFKTNISALFSLKKIKLVLRKRLQIQSLLSPFTLVILLTTICIFLSTSRLYDFNQSLTDSFSSSLIFWKNGFFGLLGFTLQMMMILVFGYCLAIYKPVNFALRKLSDIPANLLQGVMFVAGVTMVAGLLNWGFGLIVGALLARFVAVALKEKGKNSNAGLLAASGYSGMAVWHGGFSGSAPLKVAEQGHFLEDSVGVIGIDQTILSKENVLITLGLCFIFVLTLSILAILNKNTTEAKYAHPLRPIPAGEDFPIARGLGWLMIISLVFAFVFGDGEIMTFFDLNLVNFLLFSIVLIAYRDMRSFSESVTEGLKSSVDIFIQFPFYAGILGLLTDSGLLNEVSLWVVESSSLETLSSFTLVSAALINFFVPSGGGQWAVQGPVMMEAAKTFGLDPSKIVLAFSYGDQISNLLQPFWALPLLAITGVSPKEVFKYTIWVFLIGFIFLLFAANLIL